MEFYGKLARLYCPQDLQPGKTIELAAPQAHYLKNVLRKNPGDEVRIFNGRDGEFRAALAGLSKKGGTASLTENIRPQPAAPKPLHLLFAPIRKNRLDFLLEKAVELGVTDLHPVITARTENRRLNEDRINAQITESAEQCERMDIPVLHPAMPLAGKLSKWDQSTPLSWCFERPADTATPLEKAPKDAFLIGPEGGFTPEEAAFLAKHDFVKSISLGETVYRAETAAILCLAAAKISR